MTIMRSVKSFGFSSRFPKGEYILFILSNHYYPEFKKFCYGFDISGRKFSQNRLAYLFLVHKNLLELFYTCRNINTFDLKEVYRIAKVQWL